LRVKGLTLNPGNKSHSAPTPLKRPMLTHYYNYKYIEHLRLTRHGEPSSIVRQPHSNGLCSLHYYNYKYIELLRLTDTGNTVLQRANPTQTAKLTPLLQLQIYRAPPVNPTRGTQFHSAPTPLKRPMLTSLLQLKGYIERV